MTTVSAKKPSTIYCTPSSSSTYLNPVSLCGSVLPNGQFSHCGTQGPTGRFNLRPMAQCTQVRYLGPTGCVQCTRPAHWVRAMHPAKIAACCDFCSRVPWFDACKGYVAACFGACYFVRIRFMVQVSGMTCRTVGFVLLMYPLYG